MMKLSRETKIWAGTVIVLAVILQVVTYVRYNKLENQVAGFHESLAVAQDETEAQNAYNLFSYQTEPLFKAQEADAGRKWYCAWLCKRSTNTVNPRSAGSYINGAVGSYNQPKTPSSSSANVGGASGFGAGISLYDACLLEGHSIFYCGPLKANQE